MSRRTPRTVTPPVDLETTFERLRVLASDTEICNQFDTLIQVMYGALDLIDAINVEGRVRRFLGLPAEYPIGHGPEFRSRSKEAMTLARVVWTLMEERVVAEQRSVFRDLEENTAGLGGIEPWPWETGKEQEE